MATLLPLPVLVPVQVRNRRSGEVHRATLAKLCHIALEDGLGLWHEDVAVGSDRDPHVEAVGVHLAVVVGEATHKREELLRVAPREEGVTTPA